MGEDNELTSATFEGDGLGVSVSSILVSLEELLDNDVSVVAFKVSTEVLLIVAMVGTGLGEFSSSTGIRLSSSASALSSSSIATTLAGDLVGEGCLDDFDPGLICVPFIVTEYTSRS